MTFSDELTPEERLEDEAPDYPEAFGITFTPQVSGIALALAGAVFAGYLWINVLQPARNTYNETVNRRDQLAGQLEQLKNNLAEQPSLESLEEEIQVLQSQIEGVKLQQQEVLTLFSTDKSLEVLLFELEKMVKETNTDTMTGPAPQVQLNQISPGSPNPQGVNNDKYGAVAKNQLKRQTYNLEFVGTFAQTRLFIRKLEQLEPFFFVKEFSTSAASDQQGEYSPEQNLFVARESPALNSSITVEVIVAD